MVKLFTRPNGLPLRFHLADLYEDFDKIKYLVEFSGGKVEAEPQKNVLTFTKPEFCFKYKFVFNVQYIIDCVNAERILNVNEYYIGDLRCAPTCKMAKFCTGQDSCYGTQVAEVERLRTRKINMDESNTDQDFDSSQEEVINISDDETDETSQTKETSKSKDISKNLTGQLSQATLSDESLALIEDQISDTKSDRESNTEFVSSSDENSDTSDSDFLPEQSSTQSRSKNSQRLKSGHNVKYSKLQIVSHVNLENQSSDESEGSESEIDESSQDLLVWRDTVVKDKRKDEDGFPIKFPGSIGKPEKKLIIDFLIISSKIFSSKSYDVWMFARNLKFLPQQITENIMRGAYINHILPNIEKFNLPKKIEKKFINYRTFGRAAIKFPTSELINWAKSETKDLQKDENGYPYGEGILFQEWEKNMIIKFLTQIGIEKIEDSLAWEFACNLKIFPVHRTKESLQCEFKFNMLPKIESYDLSSQDMNYFINLRKYNPSFKTPSSNLINWAQKATEKIRKDELGFPISKDRFIQDWEKQIMVNYLIYTNQIQQALMYKTWKFACNLKIFAKQRTSSCIVSTMRDKVLPEIESFKLPKKEEDAFIKLRNGIKHKKTTVLTTEIKKWAEEVSKTREKDKDGFPKSKTSTKQFERWEHELMVEYLIKSNEIELCTKTNTFKKAVTLKIFPKKRTLSILRMEFNCNVLPVIESFGLEEEILAKFLKCQTGPRIHQAIFTEPPENLKKWAKTVLKKRQLDSDGYPVPTGYVPMWEKKLYVDFLIEAKKVREAKLLVTWQLCRALKIFPKFRSANNLKIYFINNILPEIKNFGLPAHTVDEFLQIE